MPVDELTGYTRNELAQLARRLGVRGWHSMRKDALIRTLRRRGRDAKFAKSRRKTNGSRTKPNGKCRTTARPSNGATHNRNGKLKSAQLSEANRCKDLAWKGVGGLPAGAARDRLLVKADGAYWLQVRWELTHAAIRRAEASLGLEWRGAKPLLRLMDVSDGEGSVTVGTWVRDVEIHGGVNHWYVELTEAPRSYRVLIGYVTASDRFVTLARSRVVRTPRPDSTKNLDADWGEAQGNGPDESTEGGASILNGDQDLRRVVESRLRRPMGAPTLPAGQSNRQRCVDLRVDAELIVYGTTQPDAEVTLLGEPVELRDDGSFTVRMSYPDGRRVVPIEATAADKLTSRTVVLAVERNTKHLEPQRFETDV